MNEQMQEALTEIIKKANNGIDASVGFLSGEIPDVVHQLLMWNITASSVAVFFFGNYYRAVGIYDCVDDEALRSGP